MQTLIPSQRISAKGGSVSGGNLSTQSTGRLVRQAAWLANYLTGRRAKPTNKQIG